LPIAIRRILRPIIARLEPSLAATYRYVSRPPTPNLRGDRDIEHSFIAARIPEGPGRGLDFGSGDSHLSLVAVRRGFEMTVIDRSRINWPFEHPAFTFVQGDALAMRLPAQSFGLIINCSTVEHLGLERYGDRKDLQADLEGMRQLRSLLNMDGVLLMTLPVGVDAIYPRVHRVYGRTRLPLLLDGYVVREQEFWTKNEQNRWTLATENTALDWVSTDYAYALGCFVLSRTNGAPAR
jgi:hypothetical protein